MKKYVLIIASATLVIVTSCNNATSETQDENMATAKEKAMERETEEMESETNYDDVVMELDAKREAIEGTIESIKPLEVSTTELREQIKQKWYKIHFYTDSDKVLRIKTYPYEAISKRTEEFYFDKGRLILAVIEDEGDGAIKGKEKAEMSKLYYYQNGKLIHEINNTVEGEYTIRESDGERLNEEANEYLEIYKEKQK